MNSQIKLQNKIKKILLKGVSVEHIQKLFYDLPKKQIEKGLEWLTYYAMASDPLYGEVFTSDPNTIPYDVEIDYNLTPILKGSSTLGGDIFTMMNKVLKAVEVKTKHKDSKGKSTITLKKFGTKDIALDKTKIAQHDRIMVHDFDNVSRTVLDIADHWTQIHIWDDLITKDNLHSIKLYVKKGKKEVPVPYTYRQDLLGGNFHKNQITQTYRKMNAQVKSEGSSSGLIIKPTATGKSIDPILLWTNHMYPTFKQRTFNLFVNPSLTVLTGNVLKMTKHLVGSNATDDVTVFVMASDLVPGDDPGDLNFLHHYTTVVRSEKQLQDEINKTNKHIWIYTTIHSFRKVKHALVSNKTKDIEFEYIDEVKHTVQENSSSHVECLNLKGHLKIKHRVGADANWIEGKDHKNKDYKSSMSNKTIWAETYVEMKEATAVKLGWKRKTEIQIYNQHISCLPPKLQDIITDSKKQSFVKIQGYSKPVPISWVYTVLSYFMFKLKNSERRHTMASVNNCDRADQYEQFAKKFLTILIKAYKVDKRNPLGKRLSKIYVRSIYNLGRTSKQINKAVDAIPGKYADSLIIQVKLLSEGWDPRDAWLDSWYMADPSASKVRVYQIGGRPARIESLHSPKLRSSVYIHTNVVHDEDQEISLNTLFKETSFVVDAMRIGNDTISDSVIFFPFLNMNTGPSGQRAKGSKFPASFVTLTGEQILQGFVGYHCNGKRYNPFSDFVNDVLFPDTQKFYSKVTKRNNLLMMKHTNDFISNKKYSNFLSQYSKQGQRGVIGKIRGGGHWLLNEQNQLEGKTNWTEWNKKVVESYEQDFLDIASELRKTTKKITTENIRLMGGFGPLIANKLGKKRDYVTKNLKNGCRKLEHYNPKQHKKLFTEVKKLLVDFEERKSQFHKKISTFQDEIAKEYFDPTQTNAHGKISKRVCDKFSMIEGSIMHKISNDLLRDKKKLFDKIHNDHKQQAMYLYQKLFPKFKNKSMDDLDRAVVIGLNKDYGVKHHVRGTVIENVRKKIGKLKAINKWFRQQSFQLIVKNRKKNPKNQRYYEG